MLILSRQSNMVIGDPLEFPHLGVVATSSFEITTMQSHEGDVFASDGFPTIRRCEGLPTTPCCLACKHKGGERHCDQQPPNREPYSTQSHGAPPESMNSRSPVPGFVIVPRRDVRANYGSPVAPERARSRLM
jgi:hypothetical protein